MKKLFLLLALVGMVLTACSEGGVDDDINNGGNNTEQPGGGGDGGEDNPDNPGGGEDGGEDNPDIPADKTQAIKFQDENTKFICTIFWDKNGDVELSYEEAAAVTNLYTAFKDSSILAFTELKYFTSLEKIEDSAFSGCSNLIIVTIPDSVTSIGEEAFYSCSSLKSVTIPDSVTAIEESAFNGCSSLIIVTIPDSVTSIGEEAFYSCSSLESVYCKPTTPPSIGNWVFDNNASGRKIYVPAESVVAYQTASDWSDYADSIVGYNFESGEVFEPTTPYNNQIWYTTTDGMELDPHKTTGFGANLIDNTYIDGKGVLLFDGDVTAIGYDAFYGCSSLTSVTIGNSVTEIGEDAFYDCSSLESVYCKPTTPPSIGYSVFYNNASGRMIYVPAESVKAYKTASNWSKYASSIVGYDF